MHSEEARRLLYFPHELFPTDTDYEKKVDILQASLFSEELVVFFKEELPLRSDFSVAISFCCNYTDPPIMTMTPYPTLSALTHTLPEHITHRCNSCRLGGHGRL